MQIKTLALCLLTAGTLTACDGKMMEEYSFKKSLEWSLTEKCADDEACVTAVRKMTSVCADRNNWQDFLQNQDDPAEKQRFVSGFYTCLVDAKGHALFIPDEATSEMPSGSGRTPADSNSAG